MTFLHVQLNPELRHLAMALESVLEAKPKGLPWNCAVLFILDRHPKWPEIRLIPRRRAIQFFRENTFLGCVGGEPFFAKLAHALETQTNVNRIYVIVTGNSGLVQILELEDQVN